MTDLYRFHVRGPLVLALLVSAAAFYFGLAVSPKPSNAPREEFSAMRAMAHTFGMALEFRAASTEAIERARDYLAEMCALYGLEVEIDKRVHVDGRTIRAIETVMARIPGTDNERPFVITAHYDSTPYGPAAADDAGGCVVMLEAARALMTQERLKNDIVFVFTNDEETGGRSAREALKHRWVQNFSAILGLEARGTSGPAYMFETSEGNYDLIHALAEAGGPIRANAIMYDVYDRSPFGSDFTNMKRQGAVGYNVAYVGGFGDYHSPNDKAENLSPASTQHQGEYVMALAKYYGANDIAPAQDDNAVYFNTIGSWFVYYRAGWSPWVTALAVLAYLGAAGYAWRRRRIGVGGVLGAVSLQVTMAATVGAITLALTYATFSLYFFYMIHQAERYQIAGVLICGAICLILASTFGRRIRPEAWVLGALLPFVLGSDLLERSFPLASYALAWPALFASLSVIASTYVPESNRQGRVWLLTLGAVFALLLTTPGMHALHLMGTALAVGPVSIVSALTACVVAPAALAAFTPREARLTATAMTVLGVATWVMGWMLNGPSPDQLQMVSLSYVANKSTGEAAWISSDLGVTEWSRHFLGDDPQVGKSSTVTNGVRQEGLLVATAMTDMPAPEVELLEIRDDNTYVFRYISPGRAAKARLDVLAPAKVTAARANGEPMLDGGPGWTANFHTAPRSGVTEFELQIESPEPPRIRIVDTYFQLPDDLMAQQPPMPDYVMIKANTMDFLENNSVSSNRTHIQAEYVLDRPVAR